MTHEEVLAHRQRLGQGHILIDRGEPKRLGSQWRPNFDRFAIQQDATRVTLDGAHHDLDECRFSGAVLAENGVNLAGGNLQGDVRKRLHARIALGDALQTQKRKSRHGPRFLKDVKHRGYYSLRVSGFSKPFILGSSILSLVITATPVSV